MRFAARIIFCALVFVVVRYCYFWLVFWPRDIVMLGLVSLLLAGAAAVLAWRISASQGVLMTTAYWAVFAAALGYCVAIFYSPTLGQLIGIYITGPLGLILGGTCGVIHGLWHKAKMPLRPIDGGG